jgi:hypothetical protein
MADKQCRKGQSLMPNGSCMSDASVKKYLQREIAEPGGYSCIPDSGPVRRGISVVGKGANLMASRRGYGRCVHVSALNPQQRMRIASRIIKDRILSSNRAGRISLKGASERTSKRFPVDQQLDQAQVRATGARVKLLASNKNETLFRVRTRDGRTYVYSADQLWRF